MEWNGPGAKVPGNERDRDKSSREWKGPGAKVPGSELARVLLELSLPGANWPGSEKARYPGTDPKEHTEPSNEIAKVDDSEMTLNSTRIFAQTTRTDLNKKLVNYRRDDYDGWQKIRYFRQQNESYATN